MAIFRYTVANSEGKKLSGTVEAPEENTARKELNNLGFSILTLEETTEQPKVDSNLTRFVFEALDKSSQKITGTIPAIDEQDAYNKLQSQYNVNITALWKEGASAEEIQKAHEEGSKKLRSQLVENPHNPEEQQAAFSSKSKVENVIRQVNQLLEQFQANFDASQKAEIHKKINKLLRIKNSTNLEYILATAEDLLNYIQNQEQSLRQSGMEEQRLQLKLRTKEMLNQLHSGEGPQSLSEDVVSKINALQSSHQENQFLNNILNKIKAWFSTPEDIQLIKNQIKNYNHQLWEFILLYFKEPTPEYREKVKAGLKTIWQARKKAKQELKATKKKYKSQTTIETDIFTSLLEDLNSLSGWLLSFYILYYIVSLYLNTKDFGIEIPAGFDVYNSQIFKYILVILFLLHACTAIKINFFRKSIFADIILPICFILATSLVIFNF